MMNENDNDPASLSALTGVAPYTVTLSANGRCDVFPLAAPQPQDFWDAKDFMVRDRTQKAIADTAGTLDPDTRAKLIAEIRAKTQTHNSVLLDIDGLMYMHFLMAKRAGFKGNWDGFRLAIQGADFRKLQDNLFALCGITIDEGKSARPLDGTIAP